MTNKVINTQDNKILFADDILSTSAINLDVHREIEKIGPFGSENPEPSFIFKNVILATVDQIGVRSILNALLNLMEENLLKRWLLEVQKHSLEKN